VNVVRIGPSRESGDDVKFSKKPGDYEVGVVFGRKVVELSDDADEGGFHIANGLRGEVLTLSLQTTVVLHEFFPIELRSWRRGRWSWASGQESRHTVPWPNKNPASSEWNSSTAV
jgi:hypothetical protein